jgi:fibronectin type 3 domain-containing protein
VNGTKYFYAIQSLNPVGRSANSSAGEGAAPAAEFAAIAPPAPTELIITSSGHHHVALRWNAARGANYYSVWRTSLHKDGIGGTYPIGTILLDDALTNISYTDNSPTDGRIYSYHVTATSAGGTSDPSVAVTAVPLPDAPVSAPVSLTARWTKFRDGTGIALSWSPVPGATGYVIYRSLKTGQSFAWPADFLTALVETAYFDKGDTDKNARVKGLRAGSDYYYQVTAVNAGGISPSTTINVAAH